MERFTLTDKLVQESIKILSKINRNDKSLNLIIVGGMACQAYLKKPSLYRPINDIDTMTPIKISYSEFEDKLGKKIAEDLYKLGYASTFSKTIYGYEVKSNEEEDEFFIHISKFSNAYLERHSKWKQREVENAKEIEIMEIKGYPILIHRIEDVLVNKTRRIGRLKIKGYVQDEQLEEFEKFLEEDFESVGSANLTKKLEDVKQIRASLIYITKENFTNNTDKINSYKVKKDLYDIASLSRTIIEGKEPFDINYFRNALSTIPSIEDIYPN